MQTFGPITSNKLYIQIYNQVREAILSGAYRVGEKLPSEKEFAQMFNVSRVPVREALCALELNGLVESVQGVGVYVRQTAANSEDWIEDVEPQDIIKIRSLLEPEIAKEAAENFSDSNRKELQQIIDQFREETAAGIYTNETDKAFHSCIARASGNGLYIAICEMILKAMQQKMWELILSRTIATKKYMELNFMEHMHIAQAIMNGNAELAYSAMKDHMNNLYERYWS